MWINGSERASDTKNNESIYVSVGLEMCRNRLQIIYFAVSCSINGIDFLGEPLLQNGQYHWRRFTQTADCHDARFAETITRFGSINEKRSYTAVAVKCPMKLLWQRHLQFQGTVSTDEPHRATKRISFWSVNRSERENTSTSSVFLNIVHPEGTKQQLSEVSELF